MKFSLSLPLASSVPVFDPLSPRIDALARAHGDAGAGEERGAEKGATQQKQHGGL